MYFGQCLRGTVPTKQVAHRKPSITQHHAPRACCLGNRSRGDLAICDAATNALSVHTSSQPLPLLSLIYAPPFCDLAAALAALALAFTPPLALRIFLLLPSSPSPSL